MRPRRETRADDNNRTGRLLDYADAAYDRDPEFIGVLLDGLATDKAAEAAGNYPPAGHGYPKRG